MSIAASFPSVKKPRFIILGEEGQTTEEGAMCLWKIDWVLRFLPSGGLYRRRGDDRGGPRRPHTMVARPGPGPRHPCVSLACGPFPTPLRISGSFRVK
jgi:hypothetical protein